MSEMESVIGDKRLKAQCMCGSVRFSAVPVGREATACHCKMCQRWSAGSFFALPCGESVVIEDEVDLSFYRSSQWGERGFCSNCGSSLFWKLHGRKDYNVSLLAFDDLGGVRFTTEYFIDGKPDAYEFANETSKLTGEQVFALFSQGQDH